jgi:hypothetical protein
VSLAAKHMCLLLLQVHLYTALTLLYAGAVLGSLLLYCGCRLANASAGNCLRGLPRLPLLLNPIFAMSADQGRKGGTGSYQHGV